MRMWCANNWATAMVLQLHIDLHSLGRGVASYGLMMLSVLVPRHTCMTASMVGLGFTTAGIMRMLVLLVSATMSDINNRFMVWIVKAKKLAEVTINN